MRGKTIQVKCACGCGVIFQARVADRKRGWGRFANKSCKARKQEQRTGQCIAHSERKYLAQKLGGEPLR